MLCQLHSTNFSKKKKKKKKISKERKYNELYPKIIIKKEKEKKERPAWDPTQTTLSLHTHTQNVIWHKDFHNYYYY